MFNRSSKVHHLLLQDPYNQANILGSLISTSSARVAVSRTPTNDDRFRACRTHKPPGSRAFSRCPKRLTSKRTSAVTCRWSLPMSDIWRTTKSAEPAQTGWSRLVVSSHLNNVRTRGVQSGSIIPSKGWRWTISENDHPVAEMRCDGRSQPNVSIHLRFGEWCLCWGCHFKGGSQSLTSEDLGQEP